MTLSFEDFKAALSISEERRRLLFREGRPFFVLLSQQFRRSDLEALCDTATALRRLDRDPEGRDFLRGILRNYRVMNLFAQPSTRTAESFIAAADKLGAQSRLVASLETSSFSKGETVEDSVRTLSSFFDTIVTRHQDDDFALRAAWALHCSRRPIPVVSAGSGKSQHVTQSLLDIYTLRYAFAANGGIDGKTIAIVGDIARNRTARSLAYLLTRFAVKTIRFVSPRVYNPDDELLAYLHAHGLEVTVDETIPDLLERGAAGLDAIYMTRLQQELDPGVRGHLGTQDAYVLKAEYRERLRPDCLVLHPLPRINELPEAWDDHPGFLVWRQVRNGMWTRAALFATIHGADTHIREKAVRLLGPGEGTAPDPNPSIADS